MCAQWILRISHVILGDIPGYVRKGDLVPTGAVSTAVAAVRDSSGKHSSSCPGLVVGSDHEQMGVEGSGYVVGSISGVPGSCHLAHLRLDHNGWFCILDGCRGWVWFR